ncbi:MAG TPA: hypothetical protein V6C81_12700 [Planktothrix sp.]|jgi:hypothetical protein
MSQATSIALLPENLATLIETGTREELEQAKASVHERAVELLAALEPNSDESRAIRAVDAGFRYVVNMAIRGEMRAAVFGYPDTSAHIASDASSKDPSGLIGHARLIFDEWLRAFGNEDRVMLVCSFEDYGFFSSHEITVQFKRRSDGLFPAFTNPDPSFGGLLAVFAAA